MSRVGKLPIKIPQGVKVSFTSGLLSVEGPKGKLTQHVEDGVKISIEGNTGLIERADDSKIAKSRHGLYRNILNNMVIGVSAGFSKTLTISGVGYRAEIKGKSLLLNLGYSNQIEYVVPEGLTIEVEANTKIVVKGIDKARVGQVSAEIRSIRPPEPYKAKGVKYESEFIRRKVGKSGVK